MRSILRDALDFTTGLAVLVGLGSLFLATAGLVWNAFHTSLWLGLFALSTFCCVFFGIVTFLDNAWSKK